MSGRWDFAVTLLVGHDRGGEWSMYVYADESDDRLLGSGIATRADALEHAGLYGEHAGEVLDRAITSSPHGRPPTSNSTTRSTR